MATLMEALRGGLSSVAAPAAATDESARLQEMMRAKTGRAIPGMSGTPRASNLQEASANAATADQSKQLVQQASAQQAGVEVASAAADDSRTQGLQQVSNARAAAKQQFSAREASLVQELQQGKDGVNLERDKMKLETLGVVSRLNNDTYVQDLTQSAAESRLGDEMKFRDALATDIFGAEKELIKSKLNFDELLTADEARFTEMIGMFDLETAVAMASANASAKNQAASYTAAGNIVSTGADAYSKYDTKKNTADQQPTGPAPTPAAEPADDGYWKY